jgi:CRP-like cAMP-binding protein
LSPTPLDNRLIADLPRRERENLLPFAKRVPLAFGDTLCRAGEPHRRVYFPLGGFISLLVSVPGHPPMEMGLIGREGALGAALALGVDQAPLQAVVQGIGLALSFSVRPFQRLLRDSPGLQASLRRYLYVTQRQLAQAAACTRFHAVEPRLARWLLMSDDRAGGERIHLTHQYLADMLGVRRSAVTIAAGGLQDRGLIHYRRGEIRVLDRPGLEAASCACYAETEREYAEQFP